MYGIGSTPRYVTTQEANWGGCTALYFLTPIRAIRPNVPRRRTSWARSLLQRWIRRSCETCSKSQMSLRFATTVQGKAFFTSEYVQKVFPIIIVPLYHDDPISLCAKLTQYRDRSRRTTGRWSCWSVMRSNTPPRTDDPDHLGV